MCAIAWYSCPIGGCSTWHSATACYPEAAGTWSAQENAGHLVDLEPLWLARVRDYVEGSDELTPTDLQNRKTEEANHNNRDLALILRDFRTARECLMGKLQRLDSSVFREAIPHPRLKVPMRLVDYLHFVAEHDDHHLARIWEIIAANQDSTVQEPLDRM